MIARATSYVIFGDPIMRGTDARVRLLRHKVDFMVNDLLDKELDEIIDSLDHYLLATLRQPDLDHAVFNKVTYYVNNVISNFNLEIKW